MEKEKLHTCVLTRRDVERLLEPIADHGHCWGFIAQSMIKAEKENRKSACKQCLQKKEKTA
jgi:hypothetical protein